MRLLAVVVVTGLVTVAGSHVAAAIENRRVSEQGHPGAALTAKKRGLITVGLVGVLLAGVAVSGVTAGEWDDGWSTSRFAALTACLAAWNVIAVTEWSYARITRRLNYSMLVAAGAIVVVDTVAVGGLGELRQAVAVAALATGLYWLASWLGGIGGGDIRCLAWVSLLTSYVAGPFMVLWAIGLANILGIVAIGAVTIKGRLQGEEKGSWRSKSIAFGPWLCAACVTVLLVGQ